MWMQAMLLYSIGVPVDSFEQRPIGLSVQVGLQEWNRLQKSRGRRTMRRPTQEYPLVFVEAIQTWRGPVRKMIIAIKSLSFKIQLLQTYRPPCRIQCVSTKSASNFCCFLRTRTIHKDRTTLLWSLSPLRWGSRQRTASSVLRRTRDAKALSIHSEFHSRRIEELASQQHLLRLHL